MRDLDHFYAHFLSVNQHKMISMENKHNKLEWSAADLQQKEWLWMDHFIQ